MDSKTIYMSKITTIIQDLGLNIRGGISSTTNFLYVGILSLGIFARVWDFGKLPSGLIADEASISVDAFSLLHFGMDHTGLSYPVHFISFGSGQNALYGYVLIPFIALLGLKSLTVKIPMLISGILTLPLLYWVTYKTFNKRIALLSMFFLAISPWHIMLSRIGLESNLLPFVFLSAFACLLKSFEDPKWIIGACVLLSACLYSYVTAYFTIPLFLICVIIILIRTGKVSYHYLLAGVMAFIIFSIPIALFILINIMGLETIKIGPITIPHLPTQPRFESETSGLVNQFIPTMSLNIRLLINLLVRQYDGIIYNSIEPYGYFYGITFPFVILGIILIIWYRKSFITPKTSLLLCWLGAPMIFGFIQPVNINRINIIFIPLLICIAVSIDWLGNKFKPILPIAILSFFAAFIAFTIDYHGEIYKSISDIKFHKGLLSALQYADETSQGPICVTDKIDKPYIYVLFEEKRDPKSYISSFQYMDETQPFGEVRSLLRYTFGKENCPEPIQYVYVLTSDETPPPLGNQYKFEFFDNYVVYYPKP